MRPNMRPERLPALAPLFFAAVLVITSQAAAQSDPQPAAQGTTPAKPAAGTVPATDPTLAPLRRIGGGVTMPSLLSKVDPQFSEQARKEKFGGIVLVNLIVDANGMPRNVHVLRGVGMGLDEKAVEAVKQYKFLPAMEGGKPVAVELNVEVNFQILDSPKILRGAPLDISDEARRNHASGVILLGLIVERQGQSAERTCPPRRRHGYGRKGRRSSQAIQIRAVPQGRSARRATGHPPTPIRRKVNSPETRSIVVCGPSLSSFATLLSAIAGLAIPLAAQTATPSAHSNSDPTPVLVRSVDPRSNKAEINQVVLVGLIVDANGDPQDVHVVRSIGKELDERAVEAVKQYRFKPAMQNGKPVAVHLNVEVKFLASAPIEILHSAPLELSNEARQAHASGSIEVAFTIDTDGNPRECACPPRRRHGHGREGSGDDQTVPFPPRRRERPSRRQIHHNGAQVRREVGISHVLTTAPGNHEKISP